MEGGAKVKAFDLKIEKVFKRRTVGGFSYWLAGTINKSCVRFPVSRELFETLERGVRAGLETTIHVDMSTL